MVPKGVESEGFLLRLILVAKPNQANKKGLTLQRLNDEKVEALG